MMDVVVSQEVHHVVNAFPHQVSHHSAVVVSEMVCEKDHHHHHQVYSRDSPYEDHQA
jgi:hypothetical protein